MIALNLYEELGVERDATPAQIKTAHRRRARATHPDKHPGDPQAAEKFRRVQRAFEVLGDPQKRARYDETGDDGQSPALAAAVGLIEALFAQVIEAASADDDLVQSVLLGIRRGMDTISQNRTRAQVKEAKLSLMLERFNDGAHIARRAVEFKLAGVRAEMAGLQTEQATGTEALRILETYAYAAPVKAPANGNVFRHMDLMDMLREAGPFRNATGRW